MPTALVLDLVAAGLDAGVPPTVAVRVVSDVLTEADDPGAGLLLGRGTETGADDPAGALHRSLHLARTTGIAPASLVRSAAEQERRRRAAAQAIAARRLGVYVVVPLAVCLLPAFLVLTVIPVVLDLLHTM
jgi:tight adherence protein B